MTEEIKISQTAEETTSTASGGQQASTGGARHGAERKERKPIVAWAALLEEAVKKPGFIHEAYSRFHSYSIANQLLALFQCCERSLAPGPIATWPKWKALGRHIRKGERALMLCVPYTCTRRQSATQGDGTELEEMRTFTHFTYKPLFFVLSQTEGAEYQQAPIPEWDEQRALATLKVERVPFENLDGNVQGYARRGGKIAINPLAALPHKTLFHEVAHSLLHCQESDLTDTDQTPHGVAEVEAEAVALLCCESLGSPSAEFSRGYIQSWGNGQTISERSAQRIFHAADRILRAGRPASARPGEGECDAE